MINELRHVIGGEDLVINEKVRFHNPTMREISDYGEDKYAADLSSLIIRPYDAMVMLDDIGINYKDITDFDLFMMTVRITHPDVSLLVPEIKFGELKPGVNPENQEPILYGNTDKGVLIFDRLLYKDMVDFLRSIHFIPDAIEFNVGNEFARKMLVRRKRRELERKKNKNTESQYPSIVSSLVNNSNFKYGYEAVMGLHVSQIWDAFYRINKLQSYQNTMLGVYTGNIDTKKLDKSVLAWFDRIDINAKATIDESKLLTPTQHG